MSDSLRRNALAKILPKEYKFGSNNHPTIDMLRAYWSVKSEIAEERKVAIERHVFSCDQCWEKILHLEKEEKP